MLDSQGNFVATQFKKHQNAMDMVDEYQTMAHHHPYYTNVVNEKLKDIELVLDKTMFFCSLVTEINKQLHKKVDNLVCRVDELEIRLCDDDGK